MVINLGSWVFISDWIVAPPMSVVLVLVIFVTVDANIPAGLDSTFWADTHTLNSK